MGKRKGKTKDQHKDPRESFHLPAPLRAALTRYLDALKPRPGTSEVIRTALERYLGNAGFWPPAGDSGLRSK
jgi:hypothetical protein